MISDLASPMFAKWLNSLTLSISFAPANKLTLSVPGCPK
jgi:hypothetical protein